MNKLDLIRMIYEPNEHQERVHSDMSRFQFLLGAPGTGKTYVGLAEALWQSRFIPGNYGIYITQDLPFIVNTLQHITPPYWIASVETPSIKNGIISINCSPNPVGGDTDSISRIEIWEVDRRLPPQIVASQYGWYVVDDVPWTWNAHYLLTQRLRRRNSLRYGLYLCSGFGFPQWVRQHTCLFKTHVWRTPEFILPWDVLPSDDTLLPDRTPAVAFEESVMETQRDMDEARAELLSEPLSNLGDVLRRAVSLRDLSDIEVTAMIDNTLQGTGRENREKPSEAEVDAFIEELNALLDEPDEQPDADALPKSAPSTGN